VSLPGFFDNRSKAPGGNWQLMINTSGRDVLIFFQYFFYSTVLVASVFLEKIQEHLIKDSYPSAAEEIVMLMLDGPKNTEEHVGSVPVEEGGKFLD